EGRQVGLERHGGVVAGVLHAVARRGSGRLLARRGAGVARGRAGGGRFAAALAACQRQRDERGQQQGAGRADGVHGGSGEGGAAILAQARMAPWKPRSPSPASAGPRARPGRLRLAGAPGPLSASPTPRAPWPWWSTGLRGTPW